MPMHRSNKAQTQREDSKSEKWFFCHVARQRNRNALAIKSRRRNRH